MPLALSNGNDLLSYQKSVNFGHGRRYNITNGLDNFFSRSLTTSTPYAVLSTDTIVAVDVSSPTVLNLPLISSLKGNQRFLIIVDEGGNAGTNNITIMTAGGDLIDGLGNLKLTANYEAVMLYASGKGGDWFSTSRTSFTTSFVPSNSEDWFGLNPTTSGQAIDRLARAFRELHGAVPLPTIAISAKSLLLDGIDEYVSIPNHASLDIVSGGLTISAFLKRAVITGPNHVIVSKGIAAVNSYSLEILSNDKVRFSTAGGVYDSTSTIADLLWHHVLVVNSEQGAGGIATLFIDGVKDAAPTTVAASITNATSLFIGARAETTNFFKGNIDEVSIWNIALTDTEVALVYNSGTPDDLSRSLKREYLQGWWRLGDGSDAGLTATDYSTNVNEGLLIGGPTFVVDAPP